MTIPSLAQPPSKPHESYTIPAYSGEVYTIPTSNSVMRLLVTGKETDGAFAVVTTGGTSAGPIGFHYHREAHDVFLCLKGEINVWAGDQCRTLAGGDFASVPPVRLSYTYLSEIVSDSTLPSTCLLTDAYSKLTGYGPSIPDPFSAHRVRRPDHTGRVGGVLPLYRRALFGPHVPYFRQSQPNGSLGPEADGRHGEIRRRFRAGPQGVGPAAVDGRGWAVAGEDGAVLPKKYQGSNICRRRAVGKTPGGDEAVRQQVFDRQN